MNKLLRKITAVSLSAVLALGLISCGNTKENGSESSSNESVLTGQVSYPVTITDSYGKQITLDEEPSKIISVAPNITEIVYELGAEDKLVGRTNYCDYPAEVENVESIGTLRKPDIEKIISLEPQLVITSTHFEDENAVKLEEAGIKVISLYEEFDVNGVYTMIETLGTALNKQDRAAEMVSEMKTTVKEVEDAVAGLEEPTVYYVVGYGESGDFSAPQNTFVGQLIDMAGGNNIVPEQDSWSYNLESLLEADPEIIVVRDGEKEGFESTEAYKELTAVKEGRIYEIDNNLIDRQSYRNAEGLLTLAEIFHPEAFEQ